MEDAVLVYSYTTGGDSFNSCECELVSFSFGQNGVVGRRVRRSDEIDDG
jgi:hypothetical protein